MTPPERTLAIVPASPDDREWCARLMAASDPWITLGRRLEQCRALCADAGHLLFIARAGEKLCGFIRIHPSGVAGSPYIASVAVAPDCRGEGIGTRLLDHAEAHFPGRRHIFLCVSSFNARARQLYERRGYAVVGEFPDYVIEGASEILMLKRLVPR